MSELAIDLAAARRRHNPPLSRAPLFDGLAWTDTLKPRALAPGEVLWHQGTASDGLYVLLTGSVQVCKRLPGQREHELTRLGTGTVLGEVPLLGGGTRSATVRALTPCSLLFLCRAEFDARTSAGDPATLALRQRIVEIVCARLRRNYASVSEPATAPAGLQREPLRAIAPPRSYIARLELFRTLTPGQLDEVLSRGTVTCGPRGLVVQRAGTRPLACYVTLNGGVEDIHGATRVGFSGPGRACGYVGLLDDQPAPVSSVARERCLLLALDPDHFATLRRSQPAFARAIEADLIRTVTTADAASSRHGLDQTA